MISDGLLEKCESVLEKNGLIPIKKLGKGGFGVVYLVSKFGEKDQLLSVKCTHKKQFAKKPALKKYLKQQIDLMKSLDHPGIVKLHNFFEDGEWIFMVMEYCDEGNLSMVQTQKSECRFAYNQFCQILKEVLSALDYIHSNNIIHRDIKPENILRSRGTSFHSVTKICDFGFSREIDNTASTVCGTTYYMAPEILSRKKYDKSVDIWALGIVSYTMLFGSVPFKSMNMELEIHRKCDGGFDLANQKNKLLSSFEPHQVKILEEFFKNVFQINPTKRWSLEAIQNHFFPIRMSEVLLLKKGKNKKLADTEDSDENSPRNNRQSFELEEVRFIQNTIREVEKINFLENQELAILKYELSKVSISILSCGRPKSQISSSEKRMIQVLKQTQIINLEKFGKRLRQCKINRFSEVFNPKQTIVFQEYKEQYRLAVGHAFYKAQKVILDSEIKMRIKLRLLCCHVINRVFQKNYERNLFKYYYEWLQQNYRKSQLNLLHLQEWISEESVGKIVQTIDLINNKFYKKQCEEKL